MSDRVSAVNGSIFDLPFPDGSFDLIWAEGAIHLIGLDRGLQEWRRLLQPKGYVAVQEVVCLKNDARPADLSAFWEEGYPARRTVQGNLEAIARLGYETKEHFNLPRRSDGTSIAARSRCG